MTVSREESLDRIFHSVADATRRSILDRLRKGPLTVSELAQPYEMSLNAVSKHIKILEKAGLVRRNIQGREHLCEVEGKRLEEAMNWMQHYASFWSDRIDALEQHLIEKRKRGLR